MIEIKHNVLYSRADLAAMLDGSGVRVATFLGRLRPRKMFHGLYSGKDLLAALEKADPIVEQGEERPAGRRPKDKLQGDSDGLPKGRNRGNRRRGGTENRPGAMLDELMK